MGHPTGTRVLQDHSPQRAGLSACHAQAGDIRTVHELLGHRDVNTTMICAHVLNRVGLGVNNLADRL
jgi:integrase